MMYNNNFVVVIKSNGKVLREAGGTVRLPFGSEYSIMLKNLDSRKAVASVSVDGEDVLSGHRIIVPANKSIELKGKMLGRIVRHKFKFIERTKEISNFRGNKADDGLIRVEYWFERKQTEPMIYYDSYPIKPFKGFGNDTGDYLNDIRIGSSYGGLNGTTSINYCNSNVSSSFTLNSVKTGRSSSKTSNKSNRPRREVNEVGITVQGSRTRQDFIDGYTKDLESYSSVIVLHLKGKTHKGKVLRAMTVKTKLQCPTCGRNSKSTAKWCHNCGTNLE